MLIWQYCCNVYWCETYNDIYIVTVSQVDNWETFQCFAMITLLWRSPLYMPGERALISISHDAGRKRKKRIKSAGFPGVWKRWTWFRNQRDPLWRLFALQVTLIVKSQVAITNTSSYFSLYHRLLHFILDGVYCYIHANMQVFHQWIWLWVFLFQVRLINFQVELHGY